VVVLEEPERLRVLLVRVHVLQEATVSLDDVSVRFRVPVERVSTLQETVIRWLQRRMRYTDVWALRDLSLHVGQGEVVGIIGRNGAGKSTLLRVVAGVIKPTAGTVATNGRLVPLIDLSAGFDMELTGRENIFLNGALYGLSRADMDGKVESIIDFAEIPGFVDAPMRTYSSGMIVRLGFAIAAEMDPEVLLVDEVLSVGDERFQEKCAERFESFRDNGVTIILVSHNTNLVRSLCCRAIWLERGSIVTEARPAQVVDAYLGSLDG
jgi:ABC-type polysaccharide/polyol phosphate transport system ATPase subunit